jgi:signal transduction histidine kinase/ligand-binding sensor domain-containing protein
MTNVGRIPRLLSLCVLSLFAAVSSVWALDPSQPVSSYIRSQFIGDDKFHLTIVNYMVQSRDGFLWLVHGDRLVRFDGRQFFTRFDQYLRVLTLAVAPNGDLWLGTQEDLERIPAAALNQSDRMPATLYHPGPGPSSYIVCLHFTRSGVLWVGTQAGLYRFENGVFSVVMPGTSIQRIEEASNWHLLLSTGDGFVEWDGSRAVPHPELAAQLGVKTDKIFHVFEDSRGVTWFCTANGVARRIGNSMERLAPWGPHGHGTHNVYEDPSGTVWFGRDEGLFRATATGLEPVAQGMNVRYLYGDRDGDLWVGTNGDGLYRFKDRAVRMFTKPDGLPNNVVQTVLATNDGTVWTGFNCGGIARFDGHGFRIYNEKNGLLNSCVWSLAEDANHDLWIGTYGGGVFRMHGGKFIQYSKAQGLPSDIVPNMVAAQDGSVWFGTAAGLSCMRDGKVRNYTVADGLSGGNTIKVYGDRTGGIWYSTEKGVDHLTGDRFVHFSSLPNALVFPIGDDRSGGLYFDLWSPASHGTAIYRVQNNQAILVASNLPPVWEMVETEQGDLWLSGGRILRVPRGGLGHPHQPDEPVDLAQFGPADGLTITTGSSGHPILAVTRDGKLWIATTQGLAMLDLPRLPRTDRKPAIYIEELTVGRNQQPPGHELVLPPGTHHLELPFAAIELSSPERIRLQYRLDSVDSEWLDALSPAHAIYTNIPPGKHAFHIRACNRDGIWDRAGVVYYITQQPYFYETGWFRLATVMAGLLLLWGLYRLRLRQATARVTTRLEGRLAERSRIARELHDTLLQSFQGVVFLFQGATNLLPAGETKRRFEGALDQAEQAIVEGRDAVHEMRSSEAASELSAAINTFAEELAASQTGEGSPSIHVRVEGTPRTLNAILRDEVYRIAVEALRNALQHAQAHQIEAEIIYGERQLVLRVRDDGKGMDADVLDHGSAGHFGLPGMRERAKLIGGSLEVRSKAGSGTEVELTIPSSIAYAKSPVTRRRFFMRLRRK